MSEVLRFRKKKSMKCVKFFVTYFFKLSALCVNKESSKTKSGVQNSNEKKSYTQG